MSKKQYYLKKLREKIEECGQVLIEIDFQQQCCLEELEDYLNHLKEDDFAVDESVSCAEIISELAILRKILIQRKEIYYLQMISLLSGIDSQIENKLSQLENDIIAYGQELRQCKCILEEKFSIFLDIDQNIKEIMTLQEIYNGEEDFDEK